MGEKAINKKDERIGFVKRNKQGCLMKIVQYNNSKDMIVQFVEEDNVFVNTQWKHFETGSISNPVFNKRREGEVFTNNQGSIAKIIKYNSSKNVIVEFQDAYKYQTKATYQQLQYGNFKNPFAPSILGIGIVGIKYPISINGKQIKEFILWRNILRRCYFPQCNSKERKYIESSVCEEWLYYPNFYEWLHSQENFDKWYNGENWHIDKDILIKGNKLYSPDTCCLVPSNVNELFTKTDAFRGNTPIGVHWHSRDNVYEVNCNDPFLNKCVYLGRYDDIEQGFQAYKSYKENIIKQTAQICFDNQEIILACYNAMINYQVEITD